MGYGFVGRESCRFWKEINFSAVELMRWLKLSWKIGHVGGLEIRLHFSILFGIIVTYYIFRPTDTRRGLLALLLLIGFVLSIFLHELAHALAARLVRVEVKSIVIWLLGGFTTLSHEPERPVHRLFIYAAGPLITILLGILFFAVYYYMPYNLPFFWIYIYSRLFLALAVINIILFVFNILPVYPIDGGNILHAIVEHFFGRSSANLITMVISIPVLIGLVVLGVRTHDYILLFFCVFIAIAISTLNWHTLRWMNLGINYIFRRGAYFFLQGDYDRAVQYYTRNIEREPQQINNFLARALCYLWMLRKEWALVDIERALQIAPNNATALLLRAELYALEKNYDSALNFISRAQELNSNWAPPYIDRGSVLLGKNEFQLALEEFNKGISLLSQVPLFYVDRSMVYFRLGNPEATHKDQDSALRLSEKDALIRAEFNLQVYEGYLDWAEDYYARVLLRRPRSWYAYQGRADAYRANNEYDKAIADYTKALEINPREPRLYLGRGKSYHAKGEIDCATEDFRQILAVTDKVHLQRQAEELLASLDRE
jgi:tetratricopeptide (TPR) repeat protein/Zn-dependent protease